ncbi:hypothetical protein BN6_75220 [Saccharothrix espanaensis DSM 44229]|uniref:Uncharacterized protein n=1 Tax=Saccharothrix espanaensis (strain ATCC 51144 / DSM 44229 / JCM 9112 / NBRC 15066 / NRRL 15764) TaxID=1179773 RepID=K0KB38_SACES|nr:hypothetical protein BN6_75220 [Saccharothrix espanaensis DSM 44229]
MVQPCALRSEVGGGAVGPPRRGVPAASPRGRLALSIGRPGVVTYLLRGEFTRLLEGGHGLCSTG